MSYDSAATKARLLDAAFDEFATYGLAGARVDRIAAAAAANKQAIYAYFGSKEDLFRTVLADRCARALDTVPFAPGDLAAFVGDLFDYFIDNPKVVRLGLWRQLELPDEIEHEGPQLRVQAIVAFYRLGGAEKQVAEDLFLVVMSLAMAWSVNRPVLAKPDRASRARLAAHRRTIVAAMASIVQAVDPAALARRGTRELRPPAKPADKR